MEIYLLTKMILSNMKLYSRFMLISLLGLILTSCQDKIVNGDAFFRNYTNATITLITEKNDSFIVFSNKTCYYCPVCVSGNHADFQTNSGDIKKIVVFGKTYQFTEQGIASFKDITNYVHHYTSDQGKSNNHYYEYWLEPDIVNLVDTESSNILNE